MSDATIMDSRVDIKIIGVGAAGINAVEFLKRSGISGVNFIGVDTDALSLHSSELDNKLQIGESLTSGMSASGDPAVGREAAIRDKGKLLDLLNGADLVLLIAGFGGGTGSGALPYIAQLTREMGILTIGAITTPYTFEGQLRDRIALQALDELTKYVDSYLEISNEKISSICGSTSVEYGIRAVRNRLTRLVVGTTSLLIRPSAIDIDLADLRTVFTDAGVLGVGGGITSGKARAHRATRAALKNITPEGFDLSEARTMLVSVITGSEISLGEFNEIGDEIWSRSKLWDDDLICIVGATTDPEMQDKLSVVVSITKGWNISPLANSQGQFAQVFERNKQRTIRWLNLK